VWAHVPYEDGQGEKLRPAVVVERCGRDLTILPATTSASRWRYPNSSVEVRDLAAAGLTKPTGIKVRSVTVDIIEVVDIVGRLGEADRNSVPQLSTQGRTYSFPGSTSAQASGSSWTSSHFGSGDAA
jgi:hypothetical protein